MRLRFWILAFLLSLVSIPASYAASRKVVVAEYFTGTW
jgi:hypothetical protein